jgi:GTP-binding protein
VAVEEVVRIEGPEAPFTVERGPSGEFVVSGRQAERLVAMTDLDNEQALRRLQGRLNALGVFRELEKRGVKHGDTVRVGSFEFEWVDEGAQLGDAGLAEK